MTNVVNCVTAFVGIASAATVVGVLNPILLAVLLPAQIRERGRRSRPGSGT